jgi:hypothetical protein
VQADIGPDVKNGVARSYDPTHKSLFGLFDGRFRMGTVAKPVVRLGLSHVHVDNFFPNCNWNKSKSVESVCEDVG